MDIDPFSAGLSALLGLGGGVWAVTGYRRRHRFVRVPSLMFALTASVSGFGVLLAVAWLVGSLNVDLVVSGGLFGAVLCIGLFWWPWFRHRRRGRPMLR